MLIAKRPAILTVMYSLTCIKIKGQLWTTRSLYSYGPGRRYCSLKPWNVNNDATGLTIENDGHQYNGPHCWLNLVVNSDYVHSKGTHTNAAKIELYVQMNFGQK